MIQAVEEHAPRIGTKAACDVLGASRATVYRRRRPASVPAIAEPPEHPRALGAERERAVLEVLNSEPFKDKPPAQVYADLLDQGVYHCSERTMYRILSKNQQVRERRNQLRHPQYAKPELIATAPNQVWSWDITKLRGPQKWTYFYLYVILDIFSRFVVGWMLADAESGENASKLVKESARRQGISPDQLTLHSDRGGPMKSKALGGLLADLRIIKSHSRPHTSDDNPFSEAQFKTLKYRPQFPGRFGDWNHAHRFCQDFFAWYNTEHHHSALALLTPTQVHHGQGEAILAARQETLLQAYHQHPDRFVHGPPKIPNAPQAVYINPPTDNEAHPPHAPFSKKPKP
jgi:putative transposase